MNSTQTPSPTLLSVSFCLYGLFCSIKVPADFGPVSLNKKFISWQLTQISFTVGNFPASTFWSTALRKRLKQTNSLFFSCVPWKTWGLNPTDWVQSWPVSLISCRVPEHCWDHPTAGRIHSQGAMDQHPCLWGTSGDVPAKSLRLCLSCAMKEMTQSCVYLAYSVSRTHFSQGHCLTIALDGSCWQSSVLWRLCFFPHDSLQGKPHPFKEVSWNWVRTSGWGKFFVSVYALHLHSVCNCGHWVHRMLSYMTNNV